MIHIVFKSRKVENKPLRRIRTWQILQEAYETYELTGKLSTHFIRKTFADKVYNARDREDVETFLSQYKTVSA